MFNRQVQKNHSNKHLEIGLWITFLSVNKTWKLQPQHTSGTAVLTVTQ